MTVDPIRADAWANGRWSVEWTEFPWGDLAPPWSKRHPVRCLWCGEELQSNVAAIRKAFVARHSHPDFPDLPNSDWHRGKQPMRTRMLIRLDLIDDNPWQPREKIERESLEELAEDIHANTLLQVPLARPNPEAQGRYQTAMGHRRVAAVGLLHQQGRWEDGLMPMDVEDLSDERMIVIGLSENVQRKQLTAIEVVRAHQRAIDSTGMSIQSLADTIKMDRSTVSNNLRVLALPNFILEYVESGELSFSGAREFLHLQDEHHAHLEEMHNVVNAITGVWGTDGMPDWSQRHIRERIYVEINRVRQGGAKWRPLAGLSKHGAMGEGKLSPNFDVDDFKEAHPHTAHTIPDISSREMVRYRERVEYGNNREWTCEVQSWGQWQGAATREANRADPEVQELREAQREAKAVNDEASRLGEYLVKDPVWRGIAAQRENKGPARPVTDEERKALGTRATMKDRTSWNSRDFWKVLKLADEDDRPDYWLNRDGGPMAPYFPLEGCHGCVKGAAYVETRFSGRGKVQLACTNRRCYEDKLSEGEEAIAPQIEEGKAAISAQDRRTIQNLLDEFGMMSQSSARALVMVLLDRTEKFECLHPFGRYTEKWSYESAALIRVREMLNMDSGEYGTSGAYYLTDSRRAEIVEAVANIGPDACRELAACMMVYHLRQSGRIDTVYLQTPEPEPEIPQRSLKGPIPVGGASE